MQITFAIRGPDGVELNEAQARTALAAGSPPSTEPYLFGWLHFWHAGQPSLDLYDDLHMLFPDCLGAIAALRTQGQARLTMASHYCHVTLLAEADTVRVTKEDGEVRGAEVARYPKEELIDAWAACSRRFALYTQALAGLDPRWTALRDMMMQSPGDALPSQRR